MEKDIKEFLGFISQFIETKDIKYYSGKEGTNDLIKTLGNKQFYERRLIFGNRLERLLKIYPKNSKYFPIINRLLGQLTNPESNFWIGAYSELIGIDYLIRDYYFKGTFTTNPPQLDVDRDWKDVLVHKQNGKSNFDIYFEDLGVYMDIKAFRHILPEIIQNIIKEVKSELKLGNNVIIGPEYFMDHNNDALKISKDEIKTNLINGLNEGKTTINFEEHEMNLRVTYGSKIHFATSIFDPYKSAARNNKSIFKHANKFHVNMPFILVYVISPLFSGPINPKFGDMKEYYRAFSRRVFIQYQHEKANLANWNREYSGKMLLGETSKYLTGILYIEDRLESERPLIGYLYLNPNAKNKIKDRFESELITHGWIAESLDTFKHDNY